MLECSTFTVMRMPLIFSVVCSSMYVSLHLPRTHSCGQNLYISQLIYYKRVCLSAKSVSTRQGRMSSIELRTKRPIVQVSKVSFEGRAHNETSSRLVSSYCIQGVVRPIHRKTFKVGYTKLLLRKVIWSLCQCSAHVRPRDMVHPEWVRMRKLRLYRVHPVWLSVPVLLGGEYTELR